MSNALSDLDKKKCLESSLYYFVNDPNNDFVGRLLQQINIKYSNVIPTAAITFNKNQENFEILLNSDFFCALTGEQRVAILYHEMFHFTNKHLFRLPFLTAKEDERVLYNIAGDMSINQYIKNLPEGAVDVKDWKHKVGNKVEPFPTFQSLEVYYELLKKNQDVNEEKHKGYKPFDEHCWEGLDEETKQKMLEEAKKVIKRTIEKTQFGGSRIPDSIKDLLEELETLSAGINYKQILKQTLKRTVCSSEREATWKRPNKRYGIVSPGSKLGALPKLNFYNDSSGSISVQEQNEYLRIMDNFLAIGARKCVLAFWHTDLYYKKAYKKGEPLNQADLQSGGTDVTCVLEDIAKSKPDLSIILTDGYFEACDVKHVGEVVWIISKGGNANHPMAHVGKTILLEHLKD